MFQSKVVGPKSITSSFQMGELFHLNVIFVLATGSISIYKQARVSFHLR